MSESAAGSGTASEAGSVPDVRVVDNPASHRYELRVDDALAGFCTYDLVDGAIILTHTETDPSLAGKGMGSTLAREMLDDLRRRELVVVPLCPFIQGWIEKHPDYADLVTGPQA